MKVPSLPRLPKRFSPLTASPKSKARQVKTLRTAIQRSQRPGLQFIVHLDLYHWLFALSWRHFLLLVTAFYFGLNLLFAIVFWYLGGGIGNAEAGSFKDAFFFSIQTFSTVGYGSMYPQSLAVHILVTIEIFVGLLCLAVLTGLMFARFSRPTAKILFSQVAVICPFEGIPTLMFRAANQRNNRILEAQVRVSLTRDEMTQEGYLLRRFYDLDLVRSQTPIFGLSWLIMHPITPTSPLYGQTIETLTEVGVELWVSLTGLDETFSQTIHSRYAYAIPELRWHHRFVDIFYQTPDGRWCLELGRFHDTVSLRVPPPPTAGETLLMVD
ncbi:ion channel [Synechocystis sp. LKSZ1]|uniref:ion channel n=1 Tax=Synechocystis sp. LKSZ1 TaxID=3144951 RepID=UPI00336BCBF7